MELKKLDMPLSVIQVDNLSDIDLSVTPLFLGKTEDELSVVLPTKNVPSITVSREDDWQGFKIEGVLDFSLVGILAKIACPTGYVSLYRVTRMEVPIVPETSPSKTISVEEIFRSFVVGDVTLMSFIGISSLFVKKGYCSN